MQTILLIVFCVGVVSVIVLFKSFTNIISLFTLIFGICLELMILGLADYGYLYLPYHEELTIFVIPGITTYFFIYFKLNEKDDD
jgi:hypothetical protein